MWYIFRCKLWSFFSESDDKQKKLKIAAWKSSTMSTARWRNKFFLFFLPQGWTHSKCHFSEKIIRSHFSHRAKNLATENWNSLRRFYTTVFFPLPTTTMMILNKFYSVENISCCQKSSVRLPLSHNRHPPNEHGKLPPHFSFCCFVLSFLRRVISYKFYNEMNEENDEEKVVWKFFKSDSPSHFPKRVLELATIEHSNTNLSPFENKIL